MRRQQEGRPGARAAAGVVATYLYAALLGCIAHTSKKGGLGHGLLQAWLQLICTLHCLVALLTPAGVPPGARVG